MIATFDSGVSIVRLDVDGEVETGFLASLVCLLTRMDFEYLTRQGTLRNYVILDILVQWRAMLRHSCHHGYCYCL